MPYYNISNLLNNGAAWNPYINEELAEIAAREELLKARKGLIPGELEQNAVEIKLANGQKALIPLNLKSIAANRELIEAELGLIPGQLHELDLQRALLQARYDAGALQEGVYRANLEQSLLGAQQAIEAASDSERYQLASNAGERLSLENQQRQTRRSLGDVPPSVAASYRGSTWVDPSYDRTRDDLNAELGIQDQRMGVLGISDENIRNSTNRTRASSDAARNVAQSQFDAQMAMFNTRDEELAANQAQLDNRAASIALGTQQGALAMANLDARKAQTELGSLESDARIKALENRAANIKLGEQEYNAAMAGLATQKARTLRPQQAWSQPVTVQFGNAVDPIWQTAPMSGGGGFSHQPYFNYGGSYFGF